MKQLRYIGCNKPLGMIVEVEEKEVERLLNSGDYEEITKSIPKTKEVKDGSISIKSSKRF